MTARALAALALLVAAPQASAATPWFVPDPVAWYRRTSDAVTTTGLHQQVETLAFAVVFALFAYGAARAAYYARSTEMAALFGRLLLAAAVLMSLAPIRQVLHGTWVAAYRWSSGTYSSVQSNLLEAADGVSLLLAPFFTAGAIVNYAGRRVARETTVAAARSAGDAAAGTVGRATRYMNGVLLLFFPLFGMYAALVYASGFAVLLSMLLLPLAGALLLLPNGASWLSRWLGAYVGALFTVLFLPIVFGIAVDLGMVQPLAQMGTHMQQALEQFGAAADTLTVPAGVEVWKIGEWQAWLESVPDALLDALGGVVSILLGWLLSLVGLVVGMLVGVFLLVNLPGYVGGFIGGIGATAATAFHLARPAQGGTARAIGTRPQGAAGATESSAAPLPSPRPGGARTP